MPGEIWEISHDRPLELLGDDDDENRKPAHKSCHAVQTREHDIPRIAKAKRQKMSALGIRKRSTFPGGRNSRWKKLITGEVVDRFTGEVR
ncbi:HNH endonuclease signature motif containing protein [Aurantimonas sp. C2-4-R8]|nr:HNH endonuclease signature motif containing protein [Aurantimonas sp. C2-3-R2]